MNYIEYFKLQAKNLLRDYKTKTPYLDGEYTLYRYDPKYFDMDGLVCDYDVDEENFSLMKAQHVIAYMAGFNKWGDMLKASPVELELGKLLFDYQNKISLDDWEIFMEMTEELNGRFFGTEDRLAFFKAVFVESNDYPTEPGGYLLEKRAA